MTTPDPDAPRLVLFGRPGAGKSALLGALLRAGETQGDTLRAEVLDPSRTLAVLRDRVYRGAAFEDTDTELHTYHVRLRPWRVGTEPADVPPNAVLYDCDGRAADSLMKHPDSLATWEPAGRVASAVGAADALILVVDAAADGAELLDTFRDFAAFLDTIEGGRSFARETGGLPVFLTLTQCDRLAEPNDSAARWEARVAARKAYVLRRFAEYLEQEAGPYLAFGSIDLRVAATAVRRPGADPNEPFGVAELFRDGFAAAREQRRRRAASGRRLTWTIRGALAAVGVMLLALGGVTVFPPAAGDPQLPDRVDDYRRTEPPPARRLTDAEMPARKRTLQAFRTDPGFTDLHPELKDYVLGRLREIDDYRAFRAKLAATPAPADARTLAELARVETALTGPVAPPPEYEWPETEAGRLRDKFLADAEAIRTAEGRWSDWFRDLIRRETALVFTGNFGGGWRGEVGDLLRAGGDPPFAQTDPLPGSPDLKQSRGSAVTQAVPFEFDRVYQARQDWAAAADRLASLRDLADLLGATADPARPPLLVIPEPGPGVDSELLPGTRLGLLKTDYPDRLADSGWSLRAFPDPARAELGRRVRQSFGAGVRHVHGLIRRGSPPDTPAGWAAVGSRLKEPAFAAWGQLLRVLARLQDPAAANPVDELAGFLAAPHFDLDLKALELAIPDDLQDRRLAPAGKLAVALTHPGDPPLTRTFSVQGEPRRESGVAVYRFAVDGDGVLRYRPGDGLTAELPLRGGNQDYRLVWVRSGPDTFAFDRLRRTPQLARTGAPGPPEPATGVRLTPAGETKLPPLPVLLPDGR